jgi:D-arabinono-1,4-lactone oxidase
MAGFGMARLLCWLTLGVSAFGLGAAHVPFLVGQPWSTCAGENELGCVLAFHLWEAPIVVYQAFFAWYGLRRLAPATLPTFRVLLGGAVLLNAVFGLFETTLLVEHTRAGGPAWEGWLLATLVLAMVSGVGLGIYTATRLDAGEAASAEARRAG